MRKDLKSFLWLIYTRQKYDLWGPLKYTRMIQIVWNWGKSHVYQVQNKRSIEHTATISFQYLHSDIEKCGQKSIDLFKIGFLCVQLR